MSEEEDCTFTVVRTSDAAKKEVGSRYSDDGPSPSSPTYPPDKCIFLVPVLDYSVARYQAQRSQGDSCW
jgi:hypothetical protein